MKNTPFKLAFLIDDNKIDNIINKQILLNHKWALDVQCYLSVREVLEYLRKYQNDQKYFPDFILLDIHMPEIDGFGFLEAFEKLETNLKDLTTIFVLSSSLDPYDQKKARENKFVSTFLCKPLTNQQIAKMGSKAALSLKHSN